MLDQEEIESDSIHGHSNVLGISSPPPPSFLNKPTFQFNKDKEIFTIGEEIDSIRKGFSTFLWKIIISCHF
jgi:hypothetical protein